MLRVTLQGAATWRIQWHDPRTTYHIDCRLLPLSEFNDMMPEPRATLQGAATWRIQDATLSQFAQVGKKTTWKVWEAYDELTDALYDIGLNNLLMPESFFTRKGREMSTLPPSKATLQQHIGKACCKAATIGLVQRCRTASYHPLLTGDGLAQNSHCGCQDKTTRS